MIRTKLQSFGKSMMRNVMLNLAGPITRRLDQHELMLKTLAESTKTLKARIKRQNADPIVVLFVCHEPKMWGSISALYHAMASDPAFSPLVITLPYCHGTLSQGTFKDAGMSEFCDSIGVPSIRGYDCNTKRWSHPHSFSPDYVFFQTPYALFPDPWSHANVSICAHICYIPYGTCIFSGTIDTVANPTSFFRHVRFVFVESDYNKSKFIDRFSDEAWLIPEHVIVSGHPKLDYLTRDPNLHQASWKRRDSSQHPKILWTPRWNTWEKNCHFFEYKDFFQNFCHTHPDLDFTLRPHPLFFQNLEKTGELTRSEREQLEATYANSTNMLIDHNGDYEDTFLSTDILVSDISSLLWEFLHTGKPIIYTHRVDQFNDLGKKISKGFYWGRNESELNQTLEELLKGHDPLLKIRQSIAKEIAYRPTTGTTDLIKTNIYDDTH